MSTPLNHVPLPGSHRKAVTGATPIGPAHPHERIVVTLRIRRRAPIPHTVKLAAMSATPPDQRKYLTPEELTSEHGAAAEDIAKVVAFAACAPSRCRRNQRSAKERLAFGNRRSDRARFLE